TQTTDSDRRVGEFDRLGTRRIRWRRVGDGARRDDVEGPQPNGHDVGQLGLPRRPYEPTGVEIDAGGLGFTGGKQKQTHTRACWRDRLAKCRMLWALRY